MPPIIPQVASYQASRNAIVSFPERVPIHYKDYKAHDYFVPRLVRTSESPVFTLIGRYAKFRYRRGGGIAARRRV